MHSKNKIKKTFEVFKNTKRRKTKIASQENKKKLVLKVTLG